MNSARNAEQHWEKIPMVVESPQDLWEAAQDYFDWCIENPMSRPELIRAGARTGETLDVSVPRPFLASALCLHTGITLSYLKQMASDTSQGDWHVVCSRIYQILLTQNLEGAMIGLFNPQFTAKYLKIDKEDVAKTNPVININVIGQFAQPLLTEEQSAKEQKSNLQKSNLENGKSASAKTDS